MIGDRIKKIREKNGLTQTALSKKLGLSRSAINAWELGISIPSTQYLINLAKIFKVSTDYILEVSNSETIDISELSPDEKEIIYTLTNQFKKNKEAVAFYNRMESFIEEIPVDKIGEELMEEVKDILEEFLEDN